MKLDVFGLKIAIRAYIRIAANPVDMEDIKPRDNNYKDIFEKDLERPFQMTNFFPDPFKSLYDTSTSSLTDKCSMELQTVPAKDNEIQPSSSTKVQDQSLQNVVIPNSVKRKISTAREESDCDSKDDDGQSFEPDVTQGIRSSARRQLIQSGHSSVRDVPETDHTSPPARKKRKQKSKTPPQTPPITSSDEDVTETDTESFEDNEPSNISDNEPLDNLQIPLPPDSTNRQDSGYGDSITSPGGELPLLQQRTRSPTPPRSLNLSSSFENQFEQSPTQETHRGGSDELVSSQLTPVKPNNGELHLNSEATPQREIQEEIRDNNQDGKILSNNTHRLFI